MDRIQIKGCGTALVTPFSQNGSLDEAALRRHLRFQIESGIDFLVPCGTTGESPTLSSEEHFRVVEITLEEAKGRVPVMGGAGGNNTRRVCEGIQVLERLGVDAILSVSPYYNKPTQEGLFQHYRTLAASTRLPILAYNVPGRTGSNIEPQTLARLSTIPNIMGVKEASGTVGQTEKILSMVPENFQVFSGDDAMTLPLMSIGACGVISVAANVIPQINRITGSIYATMQTKSGPSISSGDASVEFTKPAFGCPSITVTILSDTVIPFVVIAFTGQCIAVGTRSDKIPALIVIRSRPQGKSII